MTRRGRGSVDLFGLEAGACFDVLDGSGASHRVEVVDGPTGQVKAVFGGRRTFSGIIPGGKIENGKHLLCVSESGNQCRSGAQVRRVIPKR